VVMVTAFSTSSSNATLPTTLKVTEEELGCTGPGGFRAPLGATLNMNGTALYEGVTVSSRPGVRIALTLASRFSWYFSRC